MTRTCCEVVPEKVMQLPAAAARRSQGQGQAKPAEKQHTEQRRAEGQLRRDRSESNIARLGASSSRRMARWKNSSTVREAGIATRKVGGVVLRRHCRGHRREHNIPRGGLEACNLRGILQGS